MLDHSYKPFISYPHIDSIMMFMCADNISNEFDFLIPPYLGAIAAFQSRSCSTSFFKFCSSIKPRELLLSPSFIYSPLSRSV
jgi:hypothetical protein